MTLNVVPKKGGLKDRFFYQAIELLLQQDDEGESEAKLREMLRENLQAKHKTATGRGSGSAASASRPGQEKPSFMRSFSRDERGQAKQSQLLQAKNKPQVVLWTPSTTLTSPAFMKNIKKEDSHPPVKQEAPQEEEMVVEKGNSPEDERAKRKHSEMEEEDEEVPMTSGSFPPDSPAFSSPTGEFPGSSPVGSPPSGGMPPSKKAMLGKSTEGMVHALHNRDQKIKKKLKEVKKNREARSVRPTFNK